MIDKICTCLVKKIQSKMPEVDDEKAEIILYGIQLIVGEIPKMFILIALSFILGIGWYTVFAYIAIMPYRTASGGFHLKSHLGCILGTSLFYYGTIYLSKYLVLDSIQKYCLIVGALILGIIMVSLYAPADTENVPIISRKERKSKKIMSYITLVLTLGVALIVQDSVISNILIIGTILQTLLISRIAYKITNNRYGYEVYNEQLEIID